MKVLWLPTVMGMIVAGWLLVLPVSVAISQPAPQTGASMDRSANPGGETTLESRPVETKPAIKPTEDKRTKTTLPVMGKWGKSGNDFADCVQQLHNYYYRLVAHELSKKVDSATDDREKVQEDVAAVRLGMDSGKIRDWDPKTPQRWKTWLTSADQAEIEEMQKKYQEEVRNDCYERFGK